MAREAGRQSGSAQVKAFRKKLKELIPDSEDLANDDLVVMRATHTVPEKCPILAIPMEDPRKNRACGHIYSYAGAMSLLKHSATSQNPRSRGKPEVKCPVPGCSQKLKEDLLIKDPNLERELASLKRAQARSKLTQSSQSQAFDV